MKNDIRSLTATALLLVGLTKASAKIESALAPKVSKPEMGCLFTTPCLAP
jgi:hypothetical protein